MRQEFLGMNIFEMWESGAKELEKTGVGKIITAPVRLPEKVVTALSKTIDATGDTAATLPKTAKTLPLVMLILAGGVAAYLAFAGKKGTNLIPFKM